MINYRPASISLLTVLHKVFEKAMHSRFSRHLHTNNILVTEQYGFRKGISTENPAFRLTGSIFKSINKKMHSGGIFCDLAKAFDCFSHEMFLAKLHFYRIQEHMKISMRSYLTNRSKRVEEKSPNATKHFFLTGVH